MNIVYIPPHANVTTTNNTLTDLISDQQAKSPDAAIYITGDFNKIKLDPALSNFHQYVDVPTRKENTLDLFYVNLPDAYKCATLPPSGNSDHDMAQLIGIFLCIGAFFTPRNSAFTSYVVPIWHHSSMTFFLKSKLPLKRFSF